MAGFTSMTGGSSIQGRAGLNLPRTSWANPKSLPSASPLAGLSDEELCTITIPRPALEGVKPPFTVWMAPTPPIQ